MEGKSNGRLIAFRVVAGLAALLSLLTFFFAADSWSDEGSIHRVHNLAMAVVVLFMMTIPLVLAIKSPSDSVAPFRVWLALALAGVVAGILAGDLLAPEGYLISTVVAALTYVLNPAMKDVNRCVKANLMQLGVSVVALVPAFIYGLSQGDLQKAGDPKVDTHVEFHHYSGMAWVALSLAICGIAAAFPGSGKLLAGRLVGVSAVLVGALSLVYPDFDGAYDTIWAGLTILFGVIYIALGEMDAKKAAPATRDAPVTP